jgi:hypothetical protein
MIDESPIEADEPSETENVISNTLVTPVNQFSALCGFPPARFLAVRRRGPVKKSDPSIPSFSSCTG